MRFVHLPKRPLGHTGCRVVQGSTWLIDPYWTLAPPLLAAYWLAHPQATQEWTARQVVSTALLLVWAARLTHSYFRREKWRVGNREDWRYEDMQHRFGRWWVITQARHSALGCHYKDAMLCCAYRQLIRVPGICKVATLCQICIPQCMACNTVHSALIPAFAL